MTSQIFLLSQKFSFDKLTNQFPPTEKLVKKIVFQCELRSLTEGKAVFSIIAYPAWKEKKGKWRTGIKVEAENTGGEKSIPFTVPIAFANNELLLAGKSVKKAKKKNKKNQDCEKKDEKNSFQKLTSKVFRDSELAKKSFFTLEPRISDNPHLEFDVTLNAGDRTANALANPSPPAKPAEADAEA